MGFLLPLIFIAEEPAETSQCEHIGVRAKQTVSRAAQ